MLPRPRQLAEPQLGKHRWRQPAAASTQPAEGQKKHVAKYQSIKYLLYIYCIMIINYY